jgi:hypothetical protein
MLLLLPFRRRGPKLDRAGATLGADSRNSISAMVAEQQAAGEEGLQAF